MRVAACLALPLALFVALASLGGVVIPSVYAGETRSWAAQAVGQDWVNLLVAVPWLLLSAVLALRGSRRAFLLLGAALVYTLYSYVIYAFAVHFNALFLVYCVALGLAFFSLMLLLRGFLEEDVRAWFEAGVPVRVAGGLLVAIALAFAFLWLSEIVPALVRGQAPASLAESGSATNPVHVLDLSILLPALALTGVLLWRRRASGYVLAPLLLGFAVLLALAIAGMMVVLAQRGVGGSAQAALVPGALALVSAGVLAAILRRVVPVGPSRADAPLLGREERTIAIEPAGGTHAPVT
jgi:hypothetical protein